MAEEKKEKTEEAPKSKKTMVIIMAAALVLGIGIPGAFFALGGSDKKSDDAFLEDDYEDAEESNKGLPPAVLPLETFIVNLQVKGSFLRTTIQLEFADPQLPHTIENDIPKIKDAIIRTLSSKSSSEILSADGKDKLRGELRDSVNDMIGAEEVTQVYFTEFIIQ